MASEYDSQKPRVSVETIPIGMMNVTDLAIARGSVAGDAGERPSPAPDADGRSSRPSGRPPAPRMTPIEPEALRNAAKSPQSDSDGESEVNAFLPAAGPSKALPIVGGLVLGLGILGGIAAYTRTREPSPTVTPASATPATTNPAVSATPAVTAPPVVPAAAAGTAATAPAADVTKGASPASNPPANGKATPKATATTAAPVVTAAPPATAAPPVAVPPKPKPKGKDEDDPWK